MLSQLRSDLSSIKPKTVTLYAVTAYLTVSLISKAISSNQIRKRAAYLEDIAKKKRAQRDQQIRDIVLPVLDISSSLREKILDSDATALLEMLKVGEATSEQILVVYFQRAVTIGLDLQLISELNFMEALQKARECDRLRKENPSACHGLLFGLPISLKDVFILKGTDASGGMAVRLFNPAHEDGLIVKALKEEGAIPYVKSNVPQTIFSFNTLNQTYGQARNPWDRLRMPGGSSGGEAGLIAARCSPLGLGNDIGGSVRIPSLFCGVVGFRPTSDRVTRAGSIEISVPMDYISTLKLSVGPITKSVRDASLMMKVLLNSKAHNKASLSERDPNYIRMEWREELVVTKPKGLKIGYVRSHELFPASPANKRALEEAVQAFKALGHEVIEVAFPGIQDIALQFAEISGIDGKCRMILDAIEGETPIEDHDPFIENSKRSPMFKRLLKFWLNLTGEKRAALLIDTNGPKSAGDYLDLVARQVALKKDFLKVWEKNGLDALVTPGLPTPAMKIGCSKRYDANFNIYFYI